MRLLGAKRSVSVPEAVALAHNGKSIVEISHGNPRLIVTEVRRLWGNIDWIEGPDGIISVFGYSTTELDRKEAWSMLIRPES